jgi:phosphoribosylanthranilate isomerase
MMKLKVCGMRDRENIIQLMDEVNPDFVGFIFYSGSPRYFLQRNTVIPSLVPPEKRTGVFVNTSKAEILILTSQYQLRNIQLHGNESPELCRELIVEGLTVIKAISIERKEDLLLANKYSDSCDFLLFDTKGKTHGGTGIKFNWEILQQYKLDKPYFLSGGIGPDDVYDIRKLTKQPYAIDINSRFEIKPGLKDIQKVLLFKQHFNDEK